MGFFSGEEEVTVGIVHDKLVDKYPDAIKDASIKSVLDGSPLIENIMNAILGGFAAKARKYHSYGKNTYTYGLPKSSRVTVNAIDFVVAKAVIDSIAGVSCTIRSASLGVVTDAYEVDAYLQNTYDYNLSTGTFGISPIESAPINLNPDVDPTITYSLVTYFGYINDNVPIPADLRIRLDYVITTSTPQPNTFEYVMVGDPPELLLVEVTHDPIVTNAPALVYIHIPKANTKIEQVHIVYTIDSDTSGKIIYWKYNPALGTYPQFDNIVESDLLNEYYPIVPIRENYVNLYKTPEPVTANYLTSKKILSKLGTDIKTITKSINASENAGDITTATILFALNILNSNKSAIEYSFKYWKNEATINVRDAAILQEEVTVPPKFFNNKIEEHTFNVHLLYSSIHITNFVGNIGAIGTYTVHKVIRPRGHVKVDYSQGVLSALISLNSSYFERSSLVYRYQFSDTSYQEVAIYGLIHQAYVRGYLIRKTLDTTNGFIIPVSNAVLKTMQNINESVALYEALSIVIYWMHVEETSWWQSTIFKIILVVIIVIIAIYTGYFSYEALAAITAADVAIAVAVSFLLKEVGKLGGIFAVIATVYAMYRMDIGVFAPNSLTLAPLSGAEAFMQAVTMIGSQFDILVNQKIQSVAEDFELFLKSSKEQQEKLQKAVDLLDSEFHTIDPLYIINKSFMYNSSTTPDNFYARALNSNPGIVILALPSIYVETQLALPSTNTLIFN